MKRVLLRAAVILAIVAAFIAGTITLVRGWSNSRLDRYKKELRAKGEKLRPSELLTGPVVSNTLIPRLTAANRQIGRAWPNFELMHSSGEPAWKRTNDWAAAHKLLDAAAAPLADMRDALQVHPRDLGWDQTNWSRFPSPDPSIQMRTTTFWLSAAVVIELNRERNAEALTNLLSMLDLVQCHPAESTLVCQMIRVGLASISVGASWELLQARGWTDAQLGQLQNAWQKTEMLPGLEHALQMERARGLDYFEIARGGPSNDPTLNQPPDSIGEAMYAPIWKVALVGGDELRFLETMQAFLEGLRAAREKSSGVELQKHLVPLKRGWFPDFRHPMASMLIPNITKALNRAITGEVQRQLALAAIALERYRLRHGRYPEKLDDLVPEILSAIPMDFGDGKTLRYKRVGDNYELWSVWESTRWPGSK